MKKAVIFLTFLTITLSLSSCHYCYSATVDGLDIFYGSSFPFKHTYNTNGAAVCQYTWDGSESGMDIVIPDRYKDQTIKNIGSASGFGAPYPFTVVFTPEAEYTIVSKSKSHAPMQNVHLSSGGSSEPVYIDFTLHIGKNVNNIFCRPLAFSGKLDGLEGLYKVRFYVICDAANTTYYSEDGILYYRSSGEAVEDFIYVTD